MYMGTAAGAFKQAGNEDFVFSENYAADRAYPGSIAPEAVKAALDVHEAIFAAVQGGKGGRAYQFPLI